MGMRNFFVSLGGLCIFWRVVDPSGRGVVCLHMVHVARGLRPGLGLKYEIVLRAGAGLDIIVAGRAWAS